MCVCLVLHRAGAAFCGEMRNVVFARVSQSVIRNMAREVRGVYCALLLFVRSRKPTSSSRMRPCAGHV
jgi:hypothetical protein